MAKKTKTKSGRSTAHVGDTLHKALTQQEIVHLLEALFGVLSPDLRDQALAQLKSDTRRTVEQILSPSRPSGGRKGESSELVSTAKLRQTWSGLWNAWDNIVVEATQEDGKYIEQEASWEHPYFDETAFVEDLEKVTKKMRPLIQTAFQNGFSPNAGFAQAMLDAVEEVSEELPEWLEITDGFYLEATLTTCLLEWEWLKCQKKGQDGFAFARCLLDWEDEAGNVGLDDDVFLDFFTELPEADQEVLYQGLADAKDTAPWNKHLRNTYSHWHALYMYYTESRAPEQYLDNLRTSISQQWLNGLPVIEDFLAKKDYEGSLRAVEETLAAMLKSEHRGQSWTPETSLLFSIVSGYYHNDDFRNHKTLLRYYQQAARGLGQAQQVKILEIQRTAFNHFFDWDWMLKAFEETAMPRKVCQTLFQSWRDHIVRLTKPNGWGFGNEHDPWWLDWLIESVFDEEKGPPWFQEKLDAWLADLSGKSKNAAGAEAGSFRILAHSDEDDDHDSLRLLTKDLTEVSRRKNRYPTFYKVVIRPGELSTSDEKSRQKYLKAYAPGGFLDRVMVRWKEYLHTLVPDPRHVHKADYTQHARWMVALKELAPQSYRTVLKEWRVEHERRKNLWQAMEKMGL